MTIKDLFFSGEALDLFLQLPISGPVLDIGSGQGVHANIMRDRGLQVVTLDSYHPADLCTSWPANLDPPGAFAAVWCSHVLEHSRNPGAFLDACHAALRPGGWLCVTVPPAKHDIVGGHVSIWNVGLLLYQLILAGFDCRAAKIKTYGYNISIICRRGDAPLPELVHDEGDIERLAHLFPFPVQQGFTGNSITELNWSAP